MTVCPLYLNFLKSKRTKQGICKEKSDKSLRRKSQAEALFVQEWVSRWFQAVRKSWIWEDSETSQTSSVGSEKHGSETQRGIIPWETTEDKA